MMALSERLSRALPDVSFDEPSVEPLFAIVDAAPGDLGGVSRDTPYGPCRVLTHRYDLSHRHGDRALGTFASQTLGHLPTLTGDGRLQGRVARDAIFLDIEATGLDHGAGTFAFLVGVGLFEDDAFVVHQLFLDEPSDERAMLHELIRLLDSRPMLITFNGKSYDLTVLGNRLIMQRLWSWTECNLKLRPHLDLLHLTRSLERTRLENTRLGTLERELLNFHRIDDVPGHMVPACYHHYLRTGQTAAVQGVLEHNLHDVLSMVTLADHVVGRSRPDPRIHRDPKERDGLAKLFLRRRAPGAALAVLSDFTQRGAAPRWAVETAEALATAATAARRLLMPESARRAWERLLERDPLHEEALRGLIRLESRGGHNLPRALGLARRLEAVAPSPLSTRRVQRLRARMERAKARNKRPNQMGTKTRVCPV
jgi:uncharacterized protein YprB with RNaseH-like and TPR domain